MQSRLLNAELMLDCFAKIPSPEVARKKRRQLILYLPLLASRRGGFGWLNIYIYKYNRAALRGSGLLRGRISPLTPTGLRH
jgi:hypothetical protein